MQRNLNILAYVGIISIIIGYTLTSKTHANTTLDEQLQTAIEAHALTSIQSRPQTWHRFNWDGCCSTTKL